MFHKVINIRDRLGDYPSSTMGVASSVPGQFSLCVPGHIFEKYFLVLDGERRGKERSAEIKLNIHTHTNNKHADATTTTTTPNHAASCARMEVEGIGPPAPRKPWTSNREETQQRTPPEKPCLTNSHSKDLRQ